LSVNGKDLVPAAGAPAAVRHLCAEGMNFAGIAAWCGVDDSTVARIGGRSWVSRDLYAGLAELMAMDRAERPLAARPAGHDPQRCAVCCEVVWFRRNQRTVGPDELGLRLGLSRKRLANHVDRWLPEHAGWAA